MGRPISRLDRIANYPAVMFADTAPFRYKDYHQPTDTPDKVKYDDLARVVVGLESVVTSLAGGFTRR